MSLALPYAFELASRFGDNAERWLFTSHEQPAAYGVPLTPDHERTGAARVVHARHSDMASDYPPLRGSLTSQTTTRLDLRPFALEDLDEITSIFSIPQFWHFPFGRGFSPAESRTFVEREVREWDERGFGKWVVRTRESPEILGYVGLAVPGFLPEVLPAIEVGWRLVPTAWGHGYATEGASAALEAGFTVLGLETISAFIEPANVASRAVAHRLAMIHVRDYVVPGNEHRAELVAECHVMTAATWRSLQTSVS